MANGTGTTERSSRGTPEGRSTGPFTSDDPAIGTYEQALEHIGRRSRRYLADVPLGEGSVAMFAAMVQDPNPAYWDRDVAGTVFGGPVAPPALVQATVLPLPWRPGGAQQAEFAVFAVPLPGTTLINVSTEAVHRRPFFVGERLSCYDEVLAVSEQRSTRLGTGHFVTSAFHYEDAAESSVAVVTNVMFRFGGPEGGEAS